tara:strand:+ start:3304 stop:4011 length:708 start_codon:yes stop_codon:yes gene_type:complete
MKGKRAVILAGGKGTRLRPYTLVLPKPLMPIGEYPILEVVVRQLIKNGFTHISMAVNHQASLIKTFFGDGGKWSIKIDYFEEKEPLGTMGPLKNILDLPEDFLVMNGDILTDLNFGSFYEEHIKKNSIFTICSNERSQKIDYGVLEEDENCYLKGFKEKPKINYLVSMGIYMVNKKVINLIPDIFYGFDSLMLDLLKKKENISINKFSGYWLDIGRPDDYEKAIEDFDQMKNIFL